MPRDKRKPERPISQTGSPVASDVVFGRHAVRQCLEDNDGSLEKIWIQNGLRFPGEFMLLAKRARKQGAVVQNVDRRSLDRLTGGGNHQGVAVRLSQVPIVSLSDWLASQRDVNEAVVLVLDGVQDPGNIGAVFRSAAAASVTGIILPKRGTAPLGATAMKTSAGTLRLVPAVRVANLRNALTMLKKAGFHVIGLSEKAESDIVGMNVPRKVVILAGSEDKGIRPIHLAECDELHCIPMSGPAGSLNVSVAVSIALYEIVRSKGSSPEKN